MQSPKYLGLLLLLGLAACVSAPQVITGNTASEAATLTRWTARGRLGVSSALQSGSGTFVWQQQDRDSELSVRGPAGIGALQLSLKNAQLTLKTSDGAEFDATQTVTELEQRLGVALPVAALSFWLRGVPAPGAYQWLDVAHSTLEQSGWRIAYQDWQQQQRLRLPLKLTLDRDDVHAVVKVQGWQVDE
jgi:outer membrane lipoprotein LolB